MMDELMVRKIENTEITTWDFPAIKAQLQRGLDEYASIVYTDDSIKDAKNDRSTLNKVKKAIDDARKAYRAQCLAPYEAMEPEIKELIEMVDQQRRLIDTTVKDFEARQKEEKEKAVRAFYDRKAGVLGNLADALYTTLFDPKWVNASTSKKKYEEAVIAAIDQASHDIQAIEAMQSPFVRTLTETYVSTRSMEKVSEKKAELETAAQNASISFSKPVSVPENPSSDQGEYTTLRIFANPRQLDSIMDFMKAIGVHYETL